MAKFVGPVRCAVAVFAVWLSCLVVTGQQAAVADPGDPPPLVPGQPCTSTDNDDHTVPNDSEDEALGQVRCLNGVGMNTRGRIYANCLDAEDPMADPSASRNYRDQPCTKKFSPEAIAQARLIWKINHDVALSGPLGILGTPVGVSASIQWENVLPGLNKRPDLWVYDHTEDSGTIWLGELKQKRNSDLKDVKQNQITPYTNYVNDNLDGWDPEWIDWAGLGYSDQFSMGCNDDIESYTVLPDDGELSGNGEPILGLLVIVPTMQLPARYATQSVADDEVINACPVPSRYYADPEGDPTDNPPPEGCGPDEEETFEWMRKAINFIAQAPYVVSYSIQYRKPGYYIKKWIEGKKLADQVPKAKCPDGPGGGWGDPHLTTLDGLAYDIQSVGEFELLRADELGLDLQARFVPWQGSSSVSIMDRISFLINGFQVEIDSDDHVWVDGNLVTLPEDRMLYLNGGAQVLRQDGEYLVVWPVVGDHHAALSWSDNTVQMRVSPDVETAGLLGNNNDKPLDDLATPEGLTPSSDATRTRFIHTVFADSWRVTNATSLFTYAAGEDTSTFTNTAFPSGIERIEDYPANEVADAADACVEAAAGTARDGCMYDFLATDGQISLDTALEIPSSAVSADTLSLGDDGYVNVDFEDSVPINFADDRLSQDPEAGGFAGSFRAGDQYEFRLPISSSHAGVTASVDFLVLGALSVTRQRYVQVNLDDTQDAVYFSRTGATAQQGTVTLAGQGTLADGRPFKRYRYTATLPPASRNLEGHVTVYGFTKYQQDALGIDNVEVTLDSPAPATRMPIQVNDVVAPTSDGAQGVLEQYGTRDVYTFTVPEDGYPVTVRYLTGSGYGYPCDQLVLRRVDTGAAEDGCVYEKPLDAGQYELQMTAPRGVPLPFRYAFQIHGPQQPLEYGPVDVGSTPVTLDSSTGGGVGQTQGDLNYLTLHLNVLEAGVLNLTLHCTPLAAYDCENITAIYDATTYELLQENGKAADVVPGPYTINLYPMNGPEEYDLELQVLPDDAQAIDFGEVVRPESGTDRGVLSEDDARDRYTFTVPSGGTQVTLGLLPAFVQFVYPRYNPWGAWVCKSWTLRDQNGSEYDACLDNDYLPEGTYTLDVYAPETEALPYRYGFELDTADQRHEDTFPVTIEPDQPVEVEPDPQSGQGILESLAARDVYAFTAEDFGRLSVAVTCDESESVRCPLAVLRDTGGGWADPNAMKVMPGGHYEVTVSGGGGGHHEYELSLTSVSPYDYDLGTDLTPGSVGAGSGSWTREGDLDLYEFDVPSGGAAVAFDGDGIGGVSVYSAAGDVQYPEWSPSGYVYNLTAGHYVAEAAAPWGDYDESRDYSFRLYAVPAASTQAIGVGTWDAPLTTTGTLDRSAATASYSFTTSQTETVTVETTGDATSELVDANTGDWYSTGGRTELPAGDYRLTVRASGRGPDDSFGPYEYSVGVNLASPVDSQQLILGDLVEPDPQSGLGQLEDPYAVDQYTFEVPPGGQELSFVVRGLENPCTSMWVETEEGTQLDCGVLGFPQLFDAGAYTLTVAADGVRDGFEPSDYSLRVVGLPDYAAAATVDVPVGSDATGAPATADFTQDAQIVEHGFDLDPEDLMIAPFLIIERTEGSAPYSVLDANGNRVFTETTCNWHILAWPDGGEYTLQTTGASGEHVELQLLLSEDYPSNMDYTGCNYGGGT
jgi:VWD domain-containing protein